jgi:hypothetical protein
VRVDPVDAGLIVVVHAHGQGADLVGRVVPHRDRRLGRRRRAELARLGRPAQDSPADGDEWAGLLAAARSTWLGAHDGAALVAASIVRTSGWPGETDVIDPIAAHAVDRALEHVAEIDPETDNEELVHRIQGLVLPGDDVLMRWVRDTSFGTLRDHAGSARTGAEAAHGRGLADVEHRSGSCRRRGRDASPAGGRPR